MSAPSPTNDPRITAPTKAKSTSTSGDCDGSVTKSKMSASVRSCVESDVPVDASDLDAYRKLLDEQDVKSKQPNQFWKNKYEKEAVKNWDRFYNRNQDNFYKDRHYIPFVFAELAEEEHSDRDDSKGTTGPAAGSLDSAASFSRKSFLEVGCGVGNALFPIAQQHPHLDCFGVDCSKNAVGICKKNPAYLAASEGAGEGGARLGVEVCDITSQRIPAEIAGDGGQSIDFASMIFVLSSIAPEKHLQTLVNVNRALQLGALLYFRDYAMYDLAMLRFKAASKIEDCFYVRQDGTRSFFFTTDLITELMEKAGFEAITCSYQRREVSNKKLELKMKRCWLQGKFRKVKHIDHDTDAEK